MKHTLAKLLTLLTAVTLALTGCNLIDVDQMAIIEEQNEQLAKELSATMVEYDGGTISKFEVLGPFYSNYNYMAQLYQSFGMEMSDEDIDSMLSDVARSQVLNVAVRAEVEKRGLTLSKTEEEIRQEAEESYEASLEYYMGVVQGSDEEIKRAGAEQMLYTEGISLDRLTDLVRSQYEMEALEAALQAEVGEISEDDLKAAYDAELDADEEKYTAQPNSFESDVTGGMDVACWIPEGYRTVKHVLVIPKAELLGAVTDARSGLKTAQSDLDALTAEMEALTDDEPAEGEEVRTAEAIQADIDAKNAEIADLNAALTQAEADCLAGVQDKLDLIYADLKAGKEFDAVMEAYGEDPGMQNEPAKTTGYYVCAQSNTWEPAFTQGAMALNQVGDYSEQPVISGSGVHVIYYNSDVTAGAVAFEDVHDALYTRELENAQREHSSEVMNGLVEALNPVYHMEVWAAE